MVTPITGATVNWQRLSAAMCRLPARGCVSLVQHTGAARPAFVTRPITALAALVMPDYGGDLRR